MADFKTPNLCGANELVNTALLKIDDLKNDILGKLELPASDFAASLSTKLANVKGALDGLAADLPKIPDVNIQGEITSLINDVDKTTLAGLTEFSSKLAKLELDFGETLKEKGLDVATLVAGGEKLISGGGDICALCPNLEIPAANSGTGTTTEELEERTTGATLTLTKTPKSIVSVQGKKAGGNFFTSVTYKQNGLVIVPSSEASYTEIKVTYIVSLIKEKPVESKHADKKEEKETASIVVTNSKAIETKSEKQVFNFLSELTNLSSSSLPSSETKKIEIRTAIAKAQAEIKDPAYQSKVDAHVKKSFGELSKFISNPKDYKSVTVDSGSGSNKTQPVTTIEESNVVTISPAGIKETEKKKVSEIGFINKPIEISKKYQSKEKPQSLNDPNGKIWSLKYAAAFDSGKDIELYNLKPKPHKILKIHGIEFDSDGEIKNEYYYFPEHNARKEIKFKMRERRVGQGIEIDLDILSNEDAADVKDKYLQIQTLNRHQSISSFSPSRVTGNMTVSYIVQGDNDPNKGKQRRMNLPTRVDGSIMPYQEFGQNYGDYTPRVPQLPLPPIVPPIKLNAIAITYTTLQKLDPQ